MTTAGTIVRTLLEDGEEDDLLDFDAKHDAVLMGYPDAAEVARRVSQKVDGFKCSVARPFDEEHYRRYAQAEFILVKQRAVSHGVRLHTEIEPRDAITVRRAFSDVMREYGHVYTPTIRVEDRRWRGKPDEVAVSVVCVRKDYLKLVSPKKRGSSSWYMHIRHPDVRFPEP